MLSAMSGTAPGILTVARGQRRRSYVRTTLTPSSLDDHLRVGGPLACAVAGLAASGHRVLCPITAGPGEHGPSSGDQAPHQRARLSGRGWRRGCARRHLELGCPVAKAAGDHAERPPRPVSRRARGHRGRSRLLGSDLVHHFPYHVGRGSRQTPSDVPACTVAELGARRARPHTGQLVDDDDQHPRGHGRSPPGRQQVL